MEQDHLLVGMREALAEPLLAQAGPVAALGAQRKEPPSWHSALWFNWVSPTLTTGSARQLEPEDLLPLDAAMDPTTCTSALWVEWSKEVRSCPSCPSLLRALLRVHSGTFLLLGLLKLVCDLLAFSGPLLLKLFLLWLAASPSVPPAGLAPLRPALAVWPPPPSPPDGPLWTAAPSAAPPATFPHSLALFPLSAASTAPPAGAWGGASFRLLWALLPLPRAPLGAPHAASAVWWSPLRGWDPAGPASGYALAALLGAASLLQALLGLHYSWLQNRLICRVRAGVMGVLYIKALLLRPGGGGEAMPDGAGAAPGGSTASAAAINPAASGCDQSTHLQEADDQSLPAGKGGDAKPASPSDAVAEVQTLMSVDAGRLLSLVAGAHDLWSLPMQIGLALYLLYTQVRYAFLAGLAICLLLIPVNRFIATGIKAAQTRMMMHKDERVRLMGEVLRGMRAVKMMAWEGVFVDEITTAREKELQALGTIKYLDALCVFFWAATQLIFSALTFGLVVLLGGQAALTADVAFTALALFQVLIAPINSLPWVINGMLAAFVSLRRLLGFLVAAEVQPQWVQAALQHPADQLSQHNICPPSACLAHPLPGSGRTAAEPRCSTDVASSNSKRHHSVAEDSRQAALVLADATTAACREILPPAARLIQATFSWSRGAKPCLQDICLDIPAGSLTVLVGEVGAGKSSLLAALLGELLPGSGTCEVPGDGRVGYVAQQPWILAGTVESNILLGRPMERDLYDHVLAACALEADLAGMPAGDATPVGERGAALSGGQRARVALARALYQRCGLLLLDDVLAALDNTCAEQVLACAILGPLTRGKTCVVVTSSPRCISAAQHVVRLDKGTIVFAGTPAAYWASAWGAVGRAHLSTAEGCALPALEESPGALAGGADRADTELAPHFSSSFSSPSHGSADVGLGIDGYSVRPSAPMAAIASAARGHCVESSGVAPEGEDDLRSRDVACTREHGSLPSPCAGGEEASPLHSPRASGGKTRAEEEDEEEAREVGHVRWAVYIAYLRAVGYNTGALVLVSLVLMQASRNANDLWVAWCVGSFAHSGNDDGGADWLPISNATATPISPGVATPAPAVDSGVSPAAFFLRGLFAIAGLNCLFTIVRAFSFAFAGLCAARVMHERLLARVLRAPMAFFDSTPAGRVLNRFSTDVSQVDDSLPFTLNILLACSAGLAALLLVLCCVSPMLLLVLLPVALFYRRLQLHYRETSREVRRLDVVSLSPVYSAFNEATEAAPSIRAFRAQTRFATIYLASLEQYQRACLTGAAISAWLGVRLQLMASALVTAVGVLAALSRQGLLPTFGGDDSSGSAAASAATAAALAGLSLAYALPIVQKLGDLLSWTTETENQMVGVERIMQYMALQPEPDTAAALTLPPLPALLVAAAHADDVETGPTPHSPVGSAPIADSIAGAPPSSASWLAANPIALAGAAASTLPPPTSTAAAAVEFSAVYLRYGGRGAWALDGLTLRLEVGEKLGVCGRTGAGKSSLLNALLRLVDTQSGAVLVGGVDVRTIPLRELRSTFGVVPQTPLLLRGSVRRNLDPLGLHADARLGDMLRSVRLLEPLLLWASLHPPSATHASTSSTHSSASASPLAAPAAGILMPQLSGTAAAAAATVASASGVDSEHSEGSAWCSTATAADDSRHGMAGGTGSTAALLSRLSLPDSSVHSSGGGGGHSMHGFLGGSMHGAGGDAGSSVGVGGSLGGLLGSGGRGSGGAGGGGGGGRGSSSIGSVHEMVGGVSKQQALWPGMMEGMRSVRVHQADARMVDVQVRGGRVAVDIRDTDLVTAATHSPAGAAAFPGLPGSVSAAPALASLREAAGPGLLGPAAESSSAGVAAVLDLQLGGADGASLSAGQQQLLCLARALLQGRRVVLLDECTASVDPATARLMHRVMSRSLQGCAVLQVAHNLEAIQGYDRVAVLVAGRAAEVGTHAQLMAISGGHFARLVAGSHAADQAVHPAVPSPGQQ